MTLMVKHLPAMGEDPDSHGMEHPLEKEMVGCSPWGHKESDMNE